MMTIFQIPSYPEMQNATRQNADGQVAAPRHASPAASTGGPIMESSGATLGQSLGITTMINNLQQHVESNLNIVRDPPFFPIATYQRVDLIRRIRIVEEEVQRLSLDGNLKSAASVKQLQTEATDTELAAALDKLFDLRDRLTRSGGPASPAEIEPGLILAVEI